MAQKRSQDDTFIGHKKRRYVENNNIAPACTIQNLKDGQNRSGKLLRMCLVNFMCHENLVINFNNRINFLIGSNGSGKSAILTGLIIGLGLKSRVANRSTNVKQLIKNGQNSAKIEIDLANFEWDGYDKAKFGKKITIVRNIHINGLSQYKIKNEQGQTIYHSYDDLHKILLYFNIQVDNPVFVLHQDHARNFLKDLDPKKNYQLFLKATQIETILNKLNLCVSMTSDYKYRLECYKEQSEILKNELDQLQEKYNRLQSAEEMKVLLEQYKHELLWAKISNQEDVIKELEIKMNQIVKRINIFEEKIKDINATKKSCLEEIRMVNEEIDNSEKNLQKEYTELRTIYSNFEDKNQNLEAKKQDISKLKGKMVKLQQQINLMQNKFAEKSEILNTQVQRMHQETNEKIKKFQKNIAELEAMIANTKRDIELLSRTRNEHTEQHEDYKRCLQQLRTRDDNLLKEQRQLHMTQRDNLSVYGQHTNKLLLSIQRAYKAGKFSAMPKGPVGKYVEVANEEWKGVIEYLILSCINLFVVNSTNDRKVFDQILNQEFPGISQRVITTEFHNEVYNVRNGMVHPPKGSRLLLNEIKCSDPVIMNCLIDRVHIETILLVENQNLAVQLTSDAENIPKNLQKVVLLNPLMEYFPLPLFRAYSLEPRQSRYIQVNAQERIRYLGTAINNNKVEHTRIENELKEIKQKLMDIDKKEKQLNITLIQHEKSKSNAITNLEQLQNSGFPNEYELQILENELDELKREFDITKNKLNEEQNIYNHNSQDHKIKENFYNDKKMNVKSMEEKLRSMKTKLNDKNIDLQSMSCEINEWKNKKEKLEEEIKIVELEKSNAVCKLQNLKVQIDVENRITTEKSEEQLQILINSMEKKIKKTCSSKESIYDIKTVLDNKIKKLQSSAAIMKLLKDTLNLIITSRNERFQFVKSLKETMSVRMIFVFNGFLELRQYKGGLDIKHKTQELIVEVIPRDKNIENAVSSSKSLSGGERSFATVAFLLSLWSCVDHLFYFLDEYDVFTDQVNRQIITKLLLQEAGSKPSCQYVFLTPQDVSFVKSSEELKIHRLSDPPRNE